MGLEAVQGWVGRKSLGASRTVTGEAVGGEWDGKRREETKMSVLCPARAHLPARNGLVNEVFLGLSPKTGNDQ